MRGGLVRYAPRRPVTARAPPVMRAHAAAKADEAADSHATQTGTPMPQAPAWAASPGPPPPAARHPPQETRSRFFWVCLHNPASAAASTVTSVPPVDANRSGQIDEDTAFTKTTADLAAVAVDPDSSTSAAAARAVDRVGGSAWSSSMVAQPLNTSAAWTPGNAHGPPGNQTPWTWSGPRPSQDGERRPPSHTRCHRGPPPHCPCAWLLRWPPS